MVPSNLKVLAKFGLCLNCSQKLEECLLAQIFVKIPWCSVSIICILKTKADIENSFSRMGNWETWAL